jgi:hypothetical protein
MDCVNDLTLQLLLNQKDYNKLVTRKRMETGEENQDIDKVKENKAQIIDTITQLIDGNVDDLNNAIILAFDDFTNELFKHWEMLKIKDVNKFNETKTQSEDNDTEDDSSIQSSKTEDSGKDNETTSIWSSEKVKKIGK